MRLKVATGYFMNWVNKALDLFEEHKYGIIGTLVVHTLVLGILTVVTMRTVPDPEDRSELLVEMSPKDIEDLLMPEEQKPIDPQEWLDQEIRNMSNNTTLERIAKAEQYRVGKATEQRIEDELRKLEQEEFERLSEERKARGEEIEVPELRPEKFDPSNYRQDRKPMAVEGPTTVTYQLKDRYHERIHIPAYLCKGTGKVVLKIEVSRSGEVLKARLDEANTRASEYCMIEFAQEAALKARFDRAAAAPDPQAGTITFLFLPQ